jgi:hypothetical protein
MLAVPRCGDEPINESLVGILRLIFDEATDLPA